MRRIILLISLLAPLFGNSAYSQDTGKSQVVCTMSKCSEITLKKPRFAGANSFAVSDVWTVVDDIMHVSGLIPNFQIIETKDVDNAAAIVIDGERFLAVNLDWLAIYDTDIKDHWHLYGLMAHEVGHHLQGHTNTSSGSRPPTELEADEYAGFTLAAMGANLDEAQALWKTLPERGSATHPPRHQRLAAVERGWLRKTGKVKPEPKIQEQSTPKPQAMVKDTPSITEEKPKAIVEKPKPIKEAIAKIKVTQKTVPSDPPAPIWHKRNCMPVTAVNQQAKLCFSSRLASQGNNSYAPKNTKDNNPATAWVEGVQGQGIGQAFTVVFNNRTQVNAVSIRNGYAKSQKSYARNNRVKKLTATASNGNKMTFNLHDTSDWQIIDAVSGFGPVAWISFEISGVYPGTHYQDTAITELSFE